MVDATRNEASEATVKEDSVRIFVALFDYDPVSMSPNPDAAEEELPFKEGQILKVRTFLGEISLALLLASFISVD